VGVWGLAPPPNPQSPIPNPQSPIPKNLSLMFIIVLLIILNNLIKKFSVIYRI
jgi:hypothetical protein